MRGRATPRTAAPRTPGRRAAGVLAVVLAATLASTPLAQAEPSEDDVRAAHEAVASTASQVARLEVEMARQSALLDDAWVQVSAAAEAYTRALVAQEEAEAEAALAARRHAAAQADVDAAREGLGELAMQAYRTGGAMGTAGAMLSAEGIEDLVHRSSAIDRLGDHADQAVQRFSAADVVATTLAERARESAERADLAATQAEEALAGAELAQQTAEQQVADATERRDELLAELASLRRTSVEVERERQDALDRERREREEQRAEDERDEPADEPDRTDDDDSGSDDGGSDGDDGRDDDPADEPGDEPSTPTSTPTPTKTPTPTPTSEPDPNGLGTGSQRGTAAQGRAAADWAKAQVGKEYGWGATGPDAFDCSGLTSQAWRAAGLSINRTSRDQFTQVRKIRYADMRPGDLIFYGSNTGDPQSITHVAMFVGGGQMVEAPRPGVDVRVTSIRWSGTMLYAGRP